MSYNLVLFPADSVKSAMQTSGGTPPHQTEVGLLGDGQQDLEEEGDQGDVCRLRIDGGTGGAELGYDLLDLRDAREEVWGDFLSRPQAHSTPKGVAIIRRSHRDLFNQPKKRDVGELENMLATDQFLHLVRF